MAGWTPDPQERRLDQIDAMMADQAMRRNTAQRRIASGAGQATLGDIAEMPLSDAQLAECADAPGHEPLDVVDPRDA